MWPGICNSEGTVQDFSLNKKYNFSANFSVFVNEKEHFTSNLQKFNIKNIQNKFFTFDNPYFVACCAAYCSTYLCGVSTKHFDDKTSNLITSIAKYHFYYHLKKFLRTPEKLKTHMTDKQIEFVRKNVSVKYIWT